MEEREEMEKREELEMHDCEGCCDENCEHEYEEMDRFSVTDDEGEEHNFEIISEFENDGKLYWVAQEFYEEEEEREDDEEGDEDYVVFRVEYDEEENPFLYSVEDEEFEKVSLAWNKMIEEMLVESESDGEEE